MKRRMGKEERRKRRKGSLAWLLAMAFVARLFSEVAKASAQKKEEEERREERRKEEERREERKKKKNLLCSSRLGFGDRGLGLSPLYGSVVLLAHVAGALARLVDGLLVRW